MNAKLTEWVREAGLFPWTPARRRRQEHVNFYHSDISIALLTEGEVEWAAIRGCPVCIDVQAKLVREGKDAATLRQRLREEGNPYMKMHDAKTVEEKLAILAEIQDEEETDAG